MVTGDSDSRWLRAPPCHDSSLVGPTPRLGRATRWASTALAARVRGPLVARVAAFPSGVRAHFHEAAMLLPLSGPPAAALQDHDTCPYLFMVLRGPARRRRVARCDACTASRACPIRGPETPSATTVNVRTDPSSAAAAQRGSPRPAAVSSPPRLGPDAGWMRRLS